MKRPSLLLAAFCAALAFASSASAAGNPFGVTIVRFAPQTTPAQMRAAVTAAGGAVVTDLTAIDALAVVPRAHGFAARIGTARGVTAVFEDLLFTTDRADAVPSSQAASVPAEPAGGLPDPWHPVFQWDDYRMDVPTAWQTTTGADTVGIAVLDTGVQARHRELLAAVDRKLGGNFIPCADLRALFGLGYVDRAGLRDCRDGDFEGHGTWVASRIGGALNGFASNGVAPGVRIGSYKVLAAGLGGLSSWILSGLVAACSDPRIDIVNMSIEAYADRSNPLDVQDYLLFADAADYCRARGVALFAAAGNRHVRVDRVTLTLAGRTLEGAGRVTSGSEGIATVSPGRASVEDFDLRGWLPVPGGVPGVTTVSATANAIGGAPATVPLRWQDHVGATDQLAYYSNYGSRIDLAAPGGARKYEIPSYDGGAEDVLQGGWGSFGALAAGGLLCSDPFASSLSNSACFTTAGSGFGWLQGTSMASPNAAGVAALVLSAEPALAGRSGELVRRLIDTADRSPVNYMGPNDPAGTAPALDGTPCATGYCHIDQYHPIAFADAYGAGLVAAGAAIAP